MITFKEFLLAEIKKKKDPCWKGYKQVGTKDKDGKTVPNCVPEELDEGKVRVKIGGVSSEDLHFGFESRANAKKLDASLQSMDFSEAGERNSELGKNEYSRDFNFGISYFYFGDKATMNRAVKIAKQVIDKSEESEW